MFNKSLTKVALRYRALFLDIRRDEVDMTSAITAPVAAFVRRLAENGFGVSEQLLHALNAVTADELASITACVNEVMGVDLNWAPLVKGWQVPTGETLADHLVTLLANIFGEEAGFRGETLPCGHLIPEGTFALERYNGCPFCGTPFVTAHYTYKGQGSKLKELRLFVIDDLQQVFRSLLTSPVPLDESQKDSLSLLAGQFDVPQDVEVPMRETAMIVVRELVRRGKSGEAARWMRTPTDILRYLWYEKTGKVQIIEPKTLIAHAARVNRHMWQPADRSVDAAAEKKMELRLKYDRSQCRTVARWMNGLQMTALQAVENMNPKRGMWVRMIHALRLGEYSRKEGFDFLAKVLDLFYKQEYTTWQGRVDKARLANDPDTMLRLLKERPGLFARCLFATMLRLGSERVLKAFDEVADNVPARLLLSLSNAAETYFDPKSTRIAKPITGIPKVIPANKLLTLYSEEERKAMVKGVENIFGESMSRRFAAAKTASTTIYIDPALYQIPIGVGDRSSTIQDTSCALMGTRFAVEGDAVRLFLQWGKGLPAQHLDMDLSCRVYFHNKAEDCAYYHLTCTGAKHSGDIQHIPDMVGTAEYIELSLPELEQAKAEMVAFVCNAYSNGALSPNLVVGWMSSEYPMKVSNKDGVAYDPSCVQHMVRISESNLSKGLIFGILEVQKREIVWLEMPFTGQTQRDMSHDGMMAVLRRLEEKMTIGQLLEAKASAQQLTIIDDKDEADERYTYEWALNPAEVSALLNI